MKLFKSKADFFYLVAMAILNAFTLLFLGACASPKQVVEASASSFENQCTVFGHGPYNLNQEECLDLGEKQAATNCSLTEKTSQVEMVSITQNSGRFIQLKALCLATFDQAKKSCDPASCQAVDSSSSSDIPATGH